MTLAELNTWIKLNRNITKWSWYQNGNTVRVFIHLLLKANINDGKVGDIYYRRGQYVTSYRKLAEDLGITSRQVQTALKHLVSTEEISIRSIDGRCTVITVNNYDRYQSSEKEPDAEPEQKPSRGRPRKPKTGRTSAEVEEPETKSIYIPQYWETDLPKAAWGRFASPDEYETYISDHREEALQWLTN